jgi:integrase
MPVHKLKIGELITALVNDAKEIDNSDLAQKVKTQSFKRLATKFINQIYGDSRKRESDKIAPTTARRYLTRARTAIKEFTGIHHRFAVEVERMAKKYPGHADMLGKMLELAPDDTRKAKKGLLESLLDAKEILSSVEDLDFSKSTVKNNVVKLANKHPAYSDVILTLNNSDIQYSKRILVQTLREAQQLYDDVSSLKVDHELIVNLAMDKSDKDLMAKKSNKKLGIKKNTKVYVDYPRYINQVTEILQRKPESFYGDTKNIAPLVFALCAATGRRPVEILLTGNLTVSNKNTLLFTGQAKKRDGDEDVERLIYSLVDSNVITSAFAVLRSSPTVKSLISGEAKADDYRDENSRLSGKISPHLSEFTKKFFIDNRRVFKDTRGIYGRICYQRWYLADRRWKNKDENIFFAELFGHADVNSQSHYMPYQLSNFTADYEPNIAAVNKRWEMLCELDEDMPSLARLDAGVELHDAVKTMVLDNQAIELTQTMLATKTKKFRGTIKNYLMAIGDLALPGEPLTIQNDEDVIDEPEQEQPKVNTEEEHKVDKAEKPHIQAKVLESGLWETIIKLGNKTSMFTLRAGDKITAMKTGYAFFVGDLFEFKVTIPYKNRPHFVDTLYAKNEGEAEQIAKNDAGLDGVKGPYNKIQVKKL